MTSVSCANPYCNEGHKVMVYEYTPQPEWMCGMCAGDSQCIICLATTQSKFFCKFHKQPNMLTDEERQRHAIGDKHHAAMKKKARSMTKSRSTAIIRVRHTQLYDQPYTTEYHHQFSSKTTKPNFLRKLQLFTSRHNVSTSDRVKLFLEKHCTTNLPYQSDTGDALPADAVVISDMHVYSKPSES